MILRRFTQHIRDQSWFAVGLDFLVVITGIFVGMQVTNWNEERKERLIEGSYLERLAEDMERMYVGSEQLGLNSEPIAAWIERGEERHQLVELVVKAVTTCTLGDASNIDIARGLSLAAVLPAYPVRSSAYVDLMSSGRLAQLQDAELKEAISRFFMETETFAAQLGYYRTWTIDADRTVRRHVDLEVDESPDFESNKMQARFELKEICQQRDLRNALVAALDSQHDWLWHMRQIEAALADLYEQLGDLR